MKREINCGECARLWRLSMATVKRDPVEGPEAAARGEALRQVEGRLRAPASCDGCNRPLEAGEVVTATSLSSRRNPYRPWESEFIAPPVTVGGAA